MKQRKPHTSDLTLIVVNHTRETAASILVQNGYVKTLEEGRKVVDQMNGVK